MTTVRIIKGCEEGTDRILYLNEEDAFQMWAKHYLTYLKRLYILFKESCYIKNVDWDNQISFLDFTKFTYRNSSKYLSPFV